MEVVLASNQSVVAVIPVGSTPFGVTVDDATQQVFVTNSGSDNVSVIAGSTQNVTRSIRVQHDPLGMALDARTGSLFVADGGSASVSVISVQTLQVTTNVSVGLQPTGVAWDNRTDRVYVADYGSDRVCVLNGSTQGVVANISVGHQPYAIALDNRSGNLYVTNQGSSNISVIDGAQDTLLTTIAVLAPSFPAELEGLVYDHLDDKVWVAGGPYWALVLDPVNESVYAYLFNDPEGVAIDPVDAKVCFTNSANATFICLSASGVLQQNSVPITFNETGLPSSSSWTARVYYPNQEDRGVNQTVSGASMTFGVPSLFSQYHFNYTVPPIAGFLPFPSEGVVAGNGTAPRTVTIDFIPASSSYSVAITESGLPAGTIWAISVGGTNDSGAGATLVVAGLLNGTYPFSDRAVGSFHGTPSSGSVTIAGANVSLSVNFTLYYPGRWDVTFTESGLPSTTSWSVDLGGASIRGSTAVLVLYGVLNGTYRYTIGAIAGWDPSPANGTVVVAGANRSVGISWTTSGPFRYTLTFEESGLPNGTSWTVRVNGTSNSSSSALVRFSEANGTYTWIANSTVNGTAFNTSGNVTVSGSGPNVNVTFPVPLMFRSSGLPSASPWQVTLSGDSSGARIGVSLTVVRGAVGDASVVFRVTPGSYQYAVAASGYRTVAGSIEVHPATPTTVPIGFVPNSGGPSNGTGLGLPDWAPGVGIGLLLIVSAGTLVAVLQTRRQRRDEAQRFVEQMLIRAPRFREGELSGPEPIAPPRP